MVKEFEDSDIAWRISAPTMWSWSVCGVDAGGDRQAVFYEGEGEGGWTRLDLGMVDKHHPERGVAKRLIDRADLHVWSPLKSGEMTGSVGSSDWGRDLVAACVYCDDGSESC
jgi:hypothetical protein